MPITDEGSVLILGAGVSAPFGIPLGGDLITKIADQITRESRSAYENDHFDRPHISARKTIDWAAHADVWHSFPIYGSLIRSKVDQDFRLTSEKAREADTELQKLLGLLTDQTAETIDAFIAENPGVAPITKLAVSAYILRCLYRPTGSGLHQLSLAPLASRTFEVDGRTERNWIHLLINIIRHGIDNHHVTKENKISIITFNYDTILEHVLSKQFHNRETPLEPYAEYVEILHVHGQFQPLEATCSDPSRLCQTWASGINVVNEHEPCEQVLAARTRARELIKEASKIYSIGFSFAGPNCRMLHLHKSLLNQARQLIYCNFDGNIGVKESAERYVKARSIVERAGTWDRRLGVTDFIKAGFLGEPPG